MYASNAHKYAIKQNEKIIYLDMYLTQVMSTSCAYPKASGNAPLADWLIERKPRQLGAMMNLIPVVRITPMERLPALVEGRCSKPNRILYLLESSAYPG